MGIFFLKHISDSFDEEREQIIQSLINTKISIKEAEEIANIPSKYKFNSYIPESSRWDNLKNLNSNIGAGLNRANELVEEYNPTLNGVLTSTNFDIKGKLSDLKLKDLINYFSRLRLRKSDLEKSDLLGNAFEYLIQMFAESAGSKGGAFNTPKKIVELLIKLVKPKEGMEIYDPVCGSGGMLTEARKYLEVNGKDPNKLMLSGQEINESTWVSCKLNMFLHGIKEANIKKGDTLINPQHLENDQIKQFDRVIANPPYSLRKWGHDIAEKDIFGRYKYGIPPKHSGDFAFIQHMIASLNENGIMAVLVPNGVLFRSGSEGEIRKEIIKKDLVEAAIALPKGLFDWTGIHASILIINKNKPKNKKSKVLFIDASHEFEKGKYKNYLREDDIEHILKCFDQFKEEEFFSKIKTIDNLEANKFNLSVKKYINSSPESKQIARLQIQYENYRQIPLKDLTHEINRVSVGKNFQVKENSVYLPKFIEHYPVDQIEDLKINQDDAFQLVLDSSKIQSKYLTVFLKSQLGKLMLTTLAQYYGFRTIPYIKDLLDEFIIPTPSLSEQSKIVKTNQQLQTLRIKLKDLENNYAISPISTNNVLEQINGMLNIVGGLTNAEKIINFTQKGESGILEFKSSFSVCMEGKIPKNALELASLKTIAAFLNSNGGNLLIGVDDEGNIIGLEKDLKIFSNKIDTFLKNFKNQVKAKIGEQFYPFINAEIIAVNNKKVLLVECKRSKSACFIDGKDFYVRTNPATDKLEGTKLVEYINNHFQNII